MRISSPWCPWSSLTLTLGSHSKTFDTPRRRRHKILHFLRPNPLGTRCAIARSCCCSYFPPPRPLCTALNLKSSSVFPLQSNSQRTLTPWNFSLTSSFQVARALYFPHPVGLAWLLLRMVSPFSCSCSARAAHVNSDLSTTKTTTAAASIFTLDNTRRLLKIALPLGLDVIRGLRFARVVCSTRRQGDKH